jgi:hypothetical protein
VPELSILYTINPLMSRVIHVMGLQDIPIY